jgi:hypothetical protein
MRIGWIVLALSSQLALAQLPDEPKPAISFTHPTWQQWTALGVRSLDTASTQYAIGRGAHENNIPSAIANHAASDEAYGVAVVAVEWWAIQRFVAPRHPRIARWLPLVDSAFDARPAIRNFWQHDMSTGGQLKLRRK